MNMNLANQLTLLRIIFIPLFIIAFYLPYDWRYFASALIFAFAGVTDWFDGWVARRFDQTTPFGAFLDPVADKLMVAVALILMVKSYSSPWYVVPALIIISREIIISALREWMAELGKSASVAVSFIGKAKTMMQMLAIGFLLWNDPADTTWRGWLGFTLLYMAALLTLWSMIVYLKAAWPALGTADASSSDESQ